MNKLVNILITLGMISLVVLGVKSFVPSQTKSVLGGAQTGYYQTTATNAKVAAVSATSTKVFSADTSNMYRVVCNDSATSTSIVYLYLGGFASGNAVTQTGYRLAAGSCYEMGDKNQFVGNVYAYNAGITTTTLTTVVLP